MCGLLEGRFSGFKQCVTIRKLVPVFKTPKSRGAERFLNSCRPTGREPNQRCLTYVQVIPTFGRFGAETETSLSSSFDAEVGPTSLTKHFPFGASVE